MRRFLRAMPENRDPLAITMSGVRMGERVLQIGLEDARLAGTFAIKVGLSGHAALAVTDAAAAERARRAAADAGVLIDVHVTALHDLPFPADAFDVVVIHSAGGWLATIDSSVRSGLLRESHRVVRTGGRLIVMEPGAPDGLLARLRPGTTPDAAFEAAGGTEAALKDAGFRPVRLLADRGGVRFTEGLKT